jgi:DNA polymerase-1
MIVHVDGDVIGYRAGYAAEHTLYHVHFRGEDGKQHTRTFDGATEYKAFLAEQNFEPLDFWVENEIHVEPEELALYNVRSIINAICDAMQVTEDEIIVYLSGPDNYRNGVATTLPYKGNRDPTRKPVHAPAIKQLMRSRYKAKVSDGQEADDDMAIAHMALWTSDPMSSCIATIDKDLDTVPGLHYNFATKVGRYIEPLEARRFFWQQMISGDTVDNIPGVPGYGKIKAEKLMADWKGDEWDAYQRVRALYVQAYDDKADDAIVEMGRLLYIRQRPDEWWNPPKEADNG